MTHQNQPPPEGRQTAADMSSSDNVDTSHPKGPSRAELYLELQRLRKTQSAFFRIGAEIAKSGCCHHPEWDGTEEFNPDRCAQDRLMRVFLKERKALEDKP